MLFKIIFIVLFLGILVSLIRALLGLMQQKEPSLLVVKALAWRVGLSIILFLFLLALHGLGIVELHGISAINQPK